MTVAIVTFLWNLIGHGVSTVDWETSFRLAIMFGVVLTWAKSRDIKGTVTSQESGTTGRRKK